MFVLKGVGVLPPFYANDSNCFFRSNLSLIPWSPTQRVSHPLKNKGQKPLFSKPMLHWTQWRIMKNCHPPHQFSGPPPPKILSEQWKKNPKLFRMMEKYPTLFFSWLKWCFEWSPQARQGLVPASPTGLESNKVWRLGFVGRGSCGANQLVLVSRFINVYLIWEFIGLYIDR